MMKPRAQLDQRRQRTVDLDGSGCRFINPGNDFQQGALARPVASNNSQRLAPRNFKRGILHCQKIVEAGLMAKQLGEQLAQSIGTLLDNPEALADILQSNCGQTG